MLCPISTRIQNKFLTRQRLGILILEDEIEIREVYDGLSLFQNE